MKSLQDLLEEQLKDVYSAEKQLVKALPKMAKAATSETLRQAFQNHLQETQEQVSRLDQVFERLGIKPGRKKCQAMEGLIAEGAEIIEEDAEPMVKDAGLIAAAQRVEHYEMAAYGCIRTFAELLGDHETAEILQASLDEESQADEKLTEVAMNGINAAAAEPA